MLKRASGLVLCIALLLSQASLASAGLCLRPFSDKFNQHISFKHSEGSEDVFQKARSIISHFRETKFHDTSRVRVEVFKADTSELRHTYVAVFADIRQMNLIFARASIFLESTGRLMSHAEHLASPLLRQIAGHDLTAKDMLRYYAEFKKTLEESPENTTSNHPGIQAEERFWEEVILPTIERDPDAVFITTSTYDSSSMPILSHELLHAHFFERSQYSERAIAFWKNKVTSSDQEAIKNIFRNFYDTNDERLMANEFQAYLLQRDAKYFPLGRFVDTYKQALLQALETPVN